MIELYRTVPFLPFTLVPLECMVCLGLSYLSVRFVSQEPSGRSWQVVNVHAPESSVQPEVHGGCDAMPQGWWDAVFRYFLEGRILSVS